MSETVHFKGILKESNRYENETIEDHCKRLLENKDLPSYYDSYQELLLDQNYQNIVIHDGIIYHVEKQDVDPDSDIFRASLDENGEVDFEVRYYNGGCSFDEAIKMSLKNINKKEKK